MTRDLEALGDWLAGQGVTHVGMESTGVSWKPIYAVLEGHFDLIVGNAHHIKAVPGRKTDVKDAEWIAQLVRHGLVAKSFVPPPAIRDLRELVRHRRTLIETRTATRNRVLKLLEAANIKLSGVASDVFGVSGLAMLEIVPPRSTAVPSDTAETTPIQRDRHLQFIAETGRMGWQRASGYNIRTRIEATIGRFKGVIGDGLRSRTDERRATEVNVAVRALNRMLELGRPESVRIA